MTDEIIEEIRARLVAHDAQLKAQSKEMRSLRGENEDLKAAKVKQEEKDKKQVEKDIKHKERNDKLQSLVDELKVTLEGHTTMIADASDEIVSLKATISSLKTNPPPPPTPFPQPPSTLTNVPNPVPLSTSPPPTSLALPWRCIFLLVGSASPLFYISYSATGDRWYAVMGGTSMTTSGGAMILYYLASLNQEVQGQQGNTTGALAHLYSSLKYILRRENRSLAIVGLWSILSQLGYGIGHLVDPNGVRVSGYFFISAVFWLNPPLLFMLSRLRNIISRMNPSDISSYLSTSILTVGISSITPMVYLSMDTFKVGLTRSEATS